MKKIISFLLIVVMTLTIMTARLTVNADEGGNPFVDVTPDKNFYKEVIWAYNSEPQIVSGISATKFKPYNQCNRAQVVSFLWRMMGCPEPETAENPFEDVSTGDFFYKAVLWASENNITSGITATRFAPFRTCTRAQFVTFLWRLDGENDSLSLENPFVDVDKHAFYYKAVLWASEMKITMGKDASHFNPDGIINRAQTVMFLYRFNDILSMNEEGVLCRIQFDAAEGSGRMDDVLLKSEAEVKEYTLPGCDFVSPDGKVFAYWLCNEIILEPGAKIPFPAKKMTFTAVWLTEEETKFSDDDGEIHFRLNLNGGVTQDPYGDIEIKSDTPVELSYDYLYGTYTYTLKGIKKSGCYCTGFVNSVTGIFATASDIYYKGLLKENAYLSAVWADGCEVSFYRGNECFYSVCVPEGTLLEDYYYDLLYKMPEPEDGETFLGFVANPGSDHYLTFTPPDDRYTRYEDTDTEKYIYNYVVEDDVIFRADYIKDGRKVCDITLDPDGRMFEYYRDGGGHMGKNPITVSLMTGDCLKQYGISIWELYQWNTGFKLAGLKKQGDTSDRLYTLAEMMEYKVDDDVIFTCIWEESETVKYTFVPGEHGKYLETSIQPSSVIEDGNLVFTMNVGKHINHFADPKYDYNTYQLKGWMRDDGVFFKNTSSVWKDMFGDMDKDLTFTAIWE